MKSDSTSEEKGVHDIFTDKQCRVLDLLIEHKTSKEIARELGISPYTVDQRISLARTRLGVSSRNELAARYRLMRHAPTQSPPADGASPPKEQPEAIYQSAVYGPPALDQGTEPVHDRASQEEDDASAPVPDREKIPFPTDSRLEYRVGPEVFEGRYGGFWRLGAIVATALFLVIIILGLFAIFDQLNDMLA